MNIIHDVNLGWMIEHGKLIRRYLAEHESEWRGLTGFRRLFARLRAERRAWRYADQNLKWEQWKRDPRNLY